MIIKALYDGVTEIEVKTFDVDANFRGWKLTTAPKNGVVPTTEKVFDISKFVVDTDKSYLGYSDVLFPSVMLTANIPKYNPDTQQEEINFMNTHVVGYPITVSGVYQNTHTNLLDLVTVGHYIQFANCRITAVDTGFNTEKKIIFEQNEQEIEYSLGGYSDYMIVTINNNFAFLGAFYSRTNSSTYYPTDPTSYGFSPMGVIRYGYTDLENTYNMFSMMNWSKYFGLSGVIPIGNPFGEQSIASTGGGNGSFDFTSDSIKLPAIPSYSALSTNMITCLVPTEQQMQGIAKEFWGSSFIDAISRIFTDNPLDSVLSLSQYPFAINHNLVTDNLVIGGVALNVPCNATNNQYMTLDFGTLDFSVPLRDNFLDYEPYTNISIHLPYIGDMKIDCCDVWNHTLNVKYRVDILTGNCIAYVLVDGNIRYTKTGNCATNLPLSGRDVGSSAKSLFNVASSVVGGAMTGNGLAMISSVEGLQPIPPVTLRNSTNNSLAILESNECYLIITTATESISGDLSSLQGFTSNITNILSNVHGYTEIISTHIENIVALDEELSEIFELLKGGVILP